MVRGSDSLCSGKWKGTGTRPDRLPLLSGSEFDSVLPGGNFSQALGKGRSNAVMIDGVMLDTGPIANALEQNQEVSRMQDSPGMLQRLDNRLGVDTVVVPFIVADHLGILVRDR